VSRKNLRDEGLHTLILSLFITISTEDMNNGKIEYAKFGKVGLNII
jgi:hypothetical protein